MNKPVECMRCHVPMEAGFLLGETGDGVSLTKWTAGRPKQLLDGHQTRAAQAAPSRDLSLSQMRIS